MKVVSLEAFSFETEWDDKIPRLSPALSFWDLKEKPKSLLIVLLTVYNNVVILLSPAPRRGASSLVRLCYTGIHNTLIRVENKS